MNLQTKDGCVHMEVFHIHMPEPGNPAVWLNLAHLLHRSGDHERCIAACERVLALEPEDQEGRQLMETVQLASLAGGDGQR